MITNYRFTVIETEREITVRKAQRITATNYMVAGAEYNTERDVDIAATDFDHAREQLNDQIRARKFPQRGQQRG